MAKHGKRYNESVAAADLTQSYEVPEAVKILRKFRAAKFDETVEIALFLNIDPKQSDQNVRGSLSLPNGVGKSKRVIAFAPEGPLAEEAKAAGAVEVGGEELVKKVQDGWLDFDVAVAHPQMMRSVAKLGRLLGPKGLMPSPKSGTVSENIAQAVREYGAGKVEYRTDSSGNLHVPLGKMSFDDKALIENVESFVNHIKAIRPSTVKGQFIRKIALSASMGPAVKINAG